MKVKCKICGYESRCGQKGVESHVKIAYGKERKRGQAVHCPLLVYRAKYCGQKEFNEDALYKMYWKDGKSTPRMAKELGVEKLTLLSAMSFYGIPYRTKKEQGKNRAIQYGVWNAGKTKHDHPSIMRYAKSRCGNNNPYFTAPNFDRRYATSCDNVKYLLRASPSRNPKTTEVRLLKVLSTAGIPFKRNFCLKLPDGRWRLFDFLVDNKLLLELQGDYWHANPRFYGPNDSVVVNRQGVLAKDIWKHDAEKKALAISYGYPFRAIWEHDLKQMSDKEIIESLDMEYTPNIMDENDDRTPLDIASVNSPFRYPGGKFYARKHIVGLIPFHTGYCELFAGGASIFFAKDKCERSILNDLDGDLVNCYMQIRDQVEALIIKLDGIDATKENHTFYKEQFIPNNDLERAMRWFYLNRISYSGIMKKQNCFWGYGEKYSMRPENWPNHLRKVSAKLQGVSITNQDFEITAGNLKKGDFVFVDPPYFNADQDKFYTCAFVKKDHFRLKDCLMKLHKSGIKLLLTYDNSREIRDLYGDWCFLSEQSWNYTISRTDDQRKDRKLADGYQGNRSEATELFITNYAI